MKKTVKSFIAILLSLVMILPLFTNVFAAHITEEIPIVYVLGKVDVIYEDKDGRSDDKWNKTLYPISIDNVDLVKHLESIMPAYVEAFTKEYGLTYPTATEQEKLDAWEKYALTIYDLIANLFSGVAMDENGDPRGNSGIIWDWDQNYRKLRDGLINEDEYKENLEKIVTDTVSPYGTYGLYDYTFHYDWRLDMYHNAEFLNQYINDVLEATGKDKCIIISRCYGCNLVAAYMDEYGCDKIEKNIIYCSTAEGSVVCGEMFSGRFNMNPDGMAEYMDDLFFGEGSGLFRTFLTGNIKTKDYLNFDTFAGIVNKIYSRISNVMMPKTLINTFASMPGYWSLVDDSYYNEAKDFVFGDSHSPTYRRTFVDKIDAYHYTITNNAKKIFADACENGMKYANIVKYGTQIAPMVESSDLLGDGIVEVPHASFGAESVRIGEKFTADYMRQAEISGTIRYISPDLTIDASTCLNPDCTWFAENIDHFDFPESVDKLLLAIARFDGQMTIYDNKEFPQYRQYEGEGNILTWAGGLYVENSRDETAGTLRKIINSFMIIIKVFKMIFSAPLFLGRL